jgi:ubiquinol-cytochrome c reductase cytochrome b subunit
MSLWGDVFCPRCNSYLWINDLGLIASFSSLPNISTTFGTDPISPNPALYLNVKGGGSDAKNDTKLLPFNTSKVRALKRIGPHNYEIISILFGSMLGDGYAEKHGEGTRFCFQQEGSHVAYLLWFHDYISKLGYCNKTVPNLVNRLALHGKLRKILRFKTFTFSSFNWIEECFYIKDPALFNRRIKVLPSCIEEFLSPLALAIWIMDDGGKVSGGIKLSTNNFTKKEVLLLCDILIKKFGLKATIQSAGAKTFLSEEFKVREDPYLIYISKTSIVKLVKIVSPYIHPSMKYKLNGYS